MPTFDKARVPVALEHHSKLDLSHDHITTTNFMDLQPVMYRHMIPSEKLSVNCQAFARLAPMAVPTYGRCRLNLRAFFVPFRTVMPNFTEFVEDTVSSSFGGLDKPNTGIVTKTPFFTNNDLLGCFINGTIVIGGSTIRLSSEVSNYNPNTDVYDFCLNSGNPTYYKFTYIGRKFYKILRSLGYSMIPNTADQSEYSALALLAYLRVYFDWYSLSAYMDTASYQMFQSWFTYNHPTIPLQLDNIALQNIARFVWRVCYDGDYFTAAWDSPVAPNDGLYSMFTFPDITFPTTGPQTLNIATSSVNGSPLLLQGVNTQSTVATQFSIDTLKALTNYMKRHQLVGARAIDRYLADYGINLPADKLNRSTYLGVSSMDIQVGDVMSHADTSTNGESNLGDYAGQGYIKGGKTFEFQTSEFGLFVIMSSILPSGGYTQGIDRNNLHLTKDQFYLAPFDNLGVQVITKGELYISKNYNFADAGQYDSTFGYTPRYAEYKVGRDQLTGDLSLDSVMSGGDSWHLMRMFDDDYWNGDIDNLQHNIQFCLGDDADQYSRIFNSTDAELDKFYMIFHFNEVAYAPCKSLFDTYDFDEHGDKITLDSNGVKMN